jgi:hypothetical protein
MRKFSLTVPFNRTLRSPGGWEGISRIQFRKMRLHLHCIFHTTDEPSRLGQPIPYSVSAGDRQSRAVKSARALPDLGSPECFREIFMADPHLNRFVDKLWRELGKGPATRLSSTTRMKLAEDLRASFSTPRTVSKPGSKERVIEFSRRGTSIDTSTDQDLIAVPRYQSQGWDLYLYLVDFLTVEYVGSKPSSRLKRYPEANTGGEKWRNSRENIVWYHPPFPLADLHDWDYDLSGGRILLPQQNIPGFDAANVIDIAKPRNTRHPGYSFKLEEREESLYTLADRAFAPKLAQFEAMMA